MEKLDYLLQRERVLRSKLNWEEYSIRIRAIKKRALNTSGRPKNFNNINRKGIRIYTGPIKTLLIEASYVETNELLLKLRRKEMELRFLYKLKK